MGMTKYCGQHTDIAQPQGHEYPVSVKRIDNIETFYAEVADELAKLRGENTRLNKLNNPKR